MTPRQLQIATLIHQGCPNKEIAYRLNLSIATVKVHVRNLLRTTGSTNRVQMLHNLFSDDAATPFLQQLDELIKRANELVKQSREFETELRVTRILLFK